MQLVMYVDTGSTYPAIITSVNKTSGLVGLTTFPDGLAPGTKTSVRYDYTGAVGTWHYHETDVI